jgi:hypothetical protein
MMPTMSFKSSYAAGVVLTILFFICFAAAIFLVKRNILCEWKTVLLTGAVAWTPILLADDMLQKKGFYDDSI